MHVPNHQPVIVLQNYQKIYTFVRRCFLHIPHVLMANWGGKVLIFRHTYNILKHHIKLIAVYHIQIYTSKCLILPYEGAIPISPRSNISYSRHFRTWTVAYVSFTALANSSTFQAESFGPGFCLAFFGRQRRRTSPSWMPNFHKLFPVPIIFP